MLNSGIHSGIGRRFQNRSRTRSTLKLVNEQRLLNSGTTWSKFETNQPRRALIIYEGIPQPTSTFREPEGKIGGSISIGSRKLVNRIIVASAVHPRWKQDYYTQLNTQVMTVYTVPILSRNDTDFLIVGIAFIYNITCIMQAEELDYTSARLN